MSKISLNRSLLIFSCCICTTLLHLPTLVAFSGSSLTVEDDTPPGRLVGNVLLDAKYDTIGSNVTYDLVSSDIEPASLFRVGRKNGKLFTKHLVDRDKLCKKVVTNDCGITLRVALQFPTGMPAYVDVYINLADQNDHAPKFPIAEQRIRIKESANRGSRFRLDLAQDADSQANSIKAYVTEPNLPGPFAIKTIRDSKSIISGLYLELKESLDRETQDKYEFVLKAIDGGSPQLSGSVKVKIFVEDHNDNGPAFINSTYRITIKERVWPKKPIVKVKALDPDLGDNGKVKYEFANTVDKSLTQLFQLSPSTGNIYLKRSLDFEESPKYQFEVVASDIVGHHMSSTATVIINVTDLNDEVPVIIVDYLNNDPVTGRKRNYAEIVENWTAPKFIAHLLVTDKDAGRNGYVVCTIAKTYSEFEIKENKRSDHTVEYNVLVTQALDHERQATMRVPVDCRDMGSPVQKTINDLTVRVLDLNDNEPKLRLIGKPKIREHLPPGTHIVTVNATDPDSGNNSRVTFSITSTSTETLDFIQINTVTGDISTQANIDRERVEPPLERLPVTVIARDHGVPPKTTSLTFDILIIDVNDNAPLFLQNPIRMKVSENQPDRVQVGEVELQDRDSLGYISLRIKSHQAIPFTVFRVHGKFFINTTRSLDREVQSEYKFTLIAIDSMAGKVHTSTGTVIITVLDVNDNAPVIIFPRQPSKPFHLSYRERRYFEILTINANDKDQEKNNGHFFFELKLPSSMGNRIPFLDVDPTTGTLRVQRDMRDQDLGRHVIGVVVRDSGNPPRETETELVIVVDKSEPHPNVGFEEGHRVDPTPRDFSGDSIVIVILTLVLILLLATVGLFIYVRHWRQAFHFLPDVIALCLGSAQEGGGAASNRASEKKRIKLRTQGKPVRDEEDPCRDFLNSGDVPAFEKQGNFDPSLYPGDYPVKSMVRGPSRLVQYKGVNYLLDDSAPNNKSHIYHELEIDDRAGPPCSEPRFPNFAPSRRRYDDCYNPTAGRPAHFQDGVVHDYQTLGVYTRQQPRHESPQLGTNPRRLYTPKQATLGRPIKEGLGHVYNSNPDLKMSHQQQYVDNSLRVGAERYENLLHDESMTSEGQPPPGIIDPEKSMNTISTEQQKRLLYSTAKHLPHSQASFV